tara:strand:+ start:169 stop:516 length:348 start_codon:yes stop_codon:yes gene_type:complete
MENNSTNQQETLGNSTTILVLGILSIFPGISCIGIVGVVLGIITLVMSKKTKAEVQANPNKYTESSIKVYKAGRVCGIVGLSLSSFAIILYTLYAVFFLTYLAALGAVLGAGSMY